MPVPNRPLSPLQTDNSSMNDERKLPPITTLADYFPRSRPKTPPRTPEGRETSSKKRKFAFDQYDDPSSEVQERWKRSMMEASAAWPRPATAYESRSSSKPADYAPPTQTRNSIAVPPRASDYGRLAPASASHYEPARQPSEQKTAAVEWQRDPPLFKLPSPTKPPFGPAGSEQTTGAVEAKPYESKPQPIHIGESHSVPLPPLKKPSLSQPYQYAGSASSTSDHKQSLQPLLDTHSVTSSRDTPYTADSWRRASSSSKSTSNNNSAGADSRVQDFPVISSSNHRWPLDSHQHARQAGAKLEESPRSPHDQRPVELGARNAGFELSNAPVSASMERSQADSRYGGTGPLSGSSPTAATDHMRRNSHILLESPQTLRYPIPPPPGGAGPPHIHTTPFQPQHPRHPEPSRHLEYGTGPPPPPPPGYLAADQHQHHPYSHHHHHSHPHPHPHTHAHAHPHPHHHAEHESPTTPRRAGEGRSQYTWEVPGMTGDHVHRKRRGNLPKESTSILNSWFSQHTAYPYPKEEEKQRLQAQTGLTMSQISNWFINARRRRRPSIAAANEENWLQSPTSSRRRARS